MGDLSGVALQAVDDVLKMHVVELEELGLNQLLWILVLGDPDCLLGGKNCLKDQVKDSLKIFPVFRVINTYTFYRKAVKTYSTSIGM